MARSLALAAVALLTAAAGATRLAAEAEEGIPKNWLTQLLPAWGGGKPRAVFEELAHDEYSSVYRWHEPNGENLAVKVVDIGDRSARRRFEQERRAMHFFEGDGGVGFRGSTRLETPYGRLGVIFMDQGDTTLDELLKDHRRPVPKLPIGTECMHQMSVSLIKSAIQLRDRVFGGQEVAQEDVTPADFTPEAVDVGLLRGGGGAAACWARLARLRVAAKSARSQAAANGALACCAYFAPEYCTGEGVATQEAFMAQASWSLATMLTQLYTGSLPKELSGNATAKGWQEHAQENVLSLRRHVRDRVGDSDVCHMLLGMLHLDPSQRTKLPDAQRKAELITKKHRGGAKKVEEKEKEKEKEKRPRGVRFDEVADAVRHSLPFRFQHLN